MACRLSPGLYMYLYARLQIARTHLALCSALGSTRFNIGVPLLCSSISHAAVLALNGHFICPRSARSTSAHCRRRQSRAQF